MKTNNVKFRANKATLTIIGIEKNLSVFEVRRIIALALVTGMANPLRKYTESQIDFEKVAEYREKFLNLIDEINYEFNFDYSEITELE